MKLIFEWDENKAKANLRSHKISFNEAKTIFNDPLLLTFPDETHSADEERFISIGVSNINRVPLRKERFMNNNKNEEMLEEYDLTGIKGVRGKYYKAYREGHTVKINKEDGSTEIRHFTLEDGAVMLDADVRKYFPIPKA